MRKSDRCVCVSMYVLVRLIGLLTLGLCPPVALGEGLRIVTVSAPWKKFSVSLTSELVDDAAQVVLCRKRAGRTAFADGLGFVTSLWNSPPLMSSLVSLPSESIKHVILLSRSGGHPLYSIKHQ